MQIFSFDPIVPENPKILILGTMPGQKSLDFNEYYAHKPNAFRKIIFSLFDINELFDYEIFTNVLRQNKIALWDTLMQCKREGSADSAIELEKPNDIYSFLRNHASVRAVLFNGQAAYKFYKKYNKQTDNISYFVMPSTSPAYAAMSFDQKLKKWSLILDILKD